MAEGVLKFAEHARDTLVNALQNDRRDEGRNVPGWSWIMSRILMCCRAYPGGVTEAILLSELFQAWCEKERAEGLWKKSRFDPSPFVQNKDKRPPSIANMVTIDSILEKNFVSLDATMQVVVVDIQVLPGTTSYILTVGDSWSANTIEHYLHCKYYDMAQGDGAILRKGRELRLSGCRLRTTRVGVSQLRLLPTEYLIVLLNEDQDDDALFLGAQFFSDTFQIVQSQGPGDYYLYGRLENVIELEPETKKGHAKQHELVLVDNLGGSMSLILCDEQIVLASILSLGSMVAVEKPLVASDSQGSYLQFGRATRLYSVPYVQMEEKINLGSTLKHNEEFEDRSDDSKLLLPRDLKGLIDLSKYPFRVLIDGLKSNMSNIALCGLVAFVNSQTPGHFHIGLEDGTGLVEVEVQFPGGWNAGELHLGQTIFISGITSRKNEHGRLSCSWTPENGSCPLLVNVTRLSAVITSPCLHSQVPCRSWTSCGQICRVKLARVLLEDIQIKRAHSLCGQGVSAIPGDQWFCDFCQSPCSNEVIRQFYGTVCFHDVLELSEREIVSFVVGEAAVNVLQVSAESFCTWPEDEKALYLFSLEGEEYFVTFYQGLPDKTSLSVGCAMRSCSQC